MTEPIHQPSQEDYLRELNYVKNERERTEAFGELVNQFDNPPDDLVAALHSMHSSAKNGFVLDSKKLKELKDNNPELYNQISPVYINFLKEKGGF